MADLLKEANRLNESRSQRLENCSLKTSDVIKILENCSLTTSDVSDGAESDLKISSTSDDLSAFSLFALTRLTSSSKKKIIFIMKGALFDLAFDGQAHKLSLV